MAMVERLTEQIVIGQGGWHPAYARTLLIRDVGDEAVVLVDGNGDGAEIEIEHWFLRDTGWVARGSSGIGPFNDEELWATGWMVTGETNGVGYAVGHAEPATTVTATWRGEVDQSTANAHGIWLCLWPDQPPPPAINGSRPEDRRRGLWLLPRGRSTEPPSDRPRIIRL